MLWRLTLEMNRFLLLALTAGLMSPIAAKAESVWLIIGWRTGPGLLSPIALEKIEMQDMTQCLEQGEKFKSKKNRKASWVECIEGK